MSRAPEVTFDLATRVGSVALANPVMTAAGTAGHGAELGAFVDLAALGALVVKSLSADPWPGNPPPRVTPVAAGILNSVGLQGPGLPAWRSGELPELLARGARVVVSIWGRTVAEFARAAALVADLPEAVVAVEVNVSCPNLEARDAIFAASPEATAAVLEATSGCGRPRWAKLSPGVANLVEVAGAALGAGAEALTLVNTLPAMRIDLERRAPVLGGRGGGLSGAALHPVAVRAVWDVRAALGPVPIVGVGGVATGEDAVELLLAGAHAVQVGTAHLADPRASLAVLAGIEAFCARHGVAAVRDLVGAAHG